MCILSKVCNQIVKARKDQRYQFKNLSMQTHIDRLLNVDVPVTVSTLVTVLFERVLQNERFWWVHNAHISIDLW